jgi:hypothetical protein
MNNPVLKVYLTVLRFLRSTVNTAALVKATQKTGESTCLIRA